ncbi:MAG: Mut7-C RNAse domain-containing protein [Thermoplasmatales archaeon]
MIIADSMLGKLSRYLRMIGYDVEYIESDKDDSYIINKSKNNLILTRDKQLHQKVSESILIRSFNALDQLVELNGKLPTPPHHFMELCSICGGFLEKIERNDRLPDYVNKEAKEIFYCKRCDKYYWNGSHTEGFKKMMERIGIEVL